MRETCIAIAACAALFLLASCGGGGGNVPVMDPTDIPPADDNQPDDTNGPDDSGELDETNGTEEPDSETAVRLLAFPLEGWTCDLSGDALPPCASDLADLDGPLYRGGYGHSGLPSPAADDAKHMPVYHDSEGPRRRLMVGVEQSVSHLGRLPVVGAHGDVELRHGHLIDGVGRETVVRYLQDASGGPLTRYPSAPEVRVIGGASQENTDRVLAAVRLINAALPEDAKLTVGDPLPGFSLSDAISSRGTYDGNGLDDTIQIEFVPCSDFHDCRGPGGPGAATWNSGISQPGGHSYIQMNLEASSLTDDRHATILLAHEMLHALGFYGGDHVSPDFDTIMSASGIYATEQGIPQPTSLLFPVDREALRALYSRLNAGDSPYSLGAWASTSTHIAGNGEHANFGVALRNGYAEPWAHGYLPAMDLANNRALSGSVTWAGVLVGLTPDAETVKGDATIDVQLATLTGRADFTRLETWAAHAPPGEAGTGTTWLDGDLGYMIAVRGNTFRETSGDDGTLTGIFTGTTHEGAAGTLERADLTAAFGALR